MEQMIAIGIIQMVICFCLVADMYLVWCLMRQGANHENHTLAYVSPFGWIS